MDDYSVDLENATFPMDFSTNSSPRIIRPSTLCLKQEWLPIELQEYLTEDFDSLPRLYLLQVITYPFLMILCNIGNTLTILTMMWERIKYARHVYISAMAAAGIVVLGFQIPDFIAETYEYSGNRTASIPAKHYFAISGASDFIQAACVQFGEWTLILFGIERLFESFPKVDLMWIILGEFVLFVLAALSVINPLIAYYTPESPDETKSLEAIANDNAFLWKWNIIQENSESGIIIAKWCVLLIIGSILIYRIFRRRAANTSKVDGYTAMAVGLIILYVITRFPDFLYHSLDIANRLPFCTYRFGYRFAAELGPVMFTGIFCNNSLGFYVFWIVSSEFRSHAKNAVCLFFEMVKGRFSGKSSNRLVGHTTVSYNRKDSGSISYGYVMK